jgi:hypothetical protein
MEKPSRRLNASRARLSWLLLVCLGASAFAACSDDDDGGTTAPPAGGEGGDARAGMPGLGGSGSPGGVGGGDGAGEAGAAGQGGQPPVAAACTACGSMECSAELSACVANQECAPWLGCVQACADDVCVAACDAQHGDAARVFSGVYQCLCDSCEADCSAIQACQKSTCVDDAALPPSAEVPRTLAETGLYAGYSLAEGGANGAGGAGGAGSAPELDPGVAPRSLASYVRHFEPKYPLWADGAEKERYVYVPKCSTIDTSDMDHWRFPVGTRFWKQFTAETNVGAQKVVVETRLMHKFGPGEADWIFAAYQWDPAAPQDPAAAVSVPNGVIDASGTTHDIPALGQCIACHGISERVLGFGAIQLSHAATGDDLTIEKVSRLGWLTVPAPGGFLVPGTPTQQAALGYLHGNCGGCHYQGSALGAGAPNDNTPLVMRLLTGQKTYEVTDTFKSTVGLIVNSPNAAITGKPRIDPMEPATSALLLRMKDRGTALQMPPLSTNSTKVADTAGGVTDVTAWVNSIPKPL